MSAIDNEAVEVAMASYKKATRAMCKSCIYDSSESGNWVEQVTMCPATDCPLWQCRPQIKRSAQKQRKKLLRLMEVSKADPDIIELCLGPTKHENGTSFSNNGESGGCE